MWGSQKKGSPILVNPHVGLLFFRLSKNRHARTQHVRLSSAQGCFLEVLAKVLRPVEVQGHGVCGQGELIGVVLNGEALKGGAHGLDRARLSFSPIMSKLVITLFVPVTGRLVHGQAHGLLCIAQGNQAPIWSAARQQRATRHTVSHAV